MFAPALGAVLGALRYGFLAAARCAFLAAALGLCVAATLMAAGPAFAQTPGDPQTKKPARPTDKMFVEATELRYDTDKDTVSAEGNARVYYKDRVLEADRVIYNRKTGRVYAEGNAKLTEADGAVLHAERFDLTDDFRDGFIESLRAETAEKTYVSALVPRGGATVPETGSYRTYFGASRAERIEGDTTVFNNGSYTACAACKNNPDRPPLWRVRAKRIIQKNDEKMIYYEDASLEFLGIPIAYVPFFSTPDPSVKRKSGILSPHPVYSSNLGYGVGIPIFWALAPDYDLTFTPTYLSKQGFLANAEWRQRLESGEYYIRANGIAQQNRSYFPDPPYGAGDHTFRGSFESKGKVYIADQWKFGWEFTLLSDKFFLNDYHIPSQTLSSHYFSETTSSIYLTGQGDRGYFDLHGYYFQGLSTRDYQPQQPLAHPVWDYNKTFDIDPATSFGIGGQAELDFNLTSLSAPSASFQSVGTQVVDRAYGLYSICAAYVPGQTIGSCLLRGVGGEYTRATLDASWKRKFIDPIGQVWTPFAFAHLNGEWLDINATNTYTFASAAGISTYSNAAQLNFLGNKDASFFGEVIPAVGLDYRYPFFAKTSFGSMLIEPIAQIILRPNQPIGAHSLVNLDAQSLVFDDSTLFQWNKYSGYDRFETGARANYGAQFSLNFKDGGYANIVAGQSYQIAGANPYAIPDAANVGLSSGLDTRLTDYVTAFSFAPNSTLSFMAKSRFDIDTLAARRVDLVGAYNFGAWTGNVQYANYQAQPVIGYYVRRQGLSLSSRYKISDNYFAQGNITFDMSRQYYPSSMIGTSNPGPFAIAAFGIGGGYQDDCTNFSVNYSSIYQDNGNGALIRNQTVLLQLQLRTLGQAAVSQSFSNTLALDGVKY
ncbi:LPS-assembly protein LptD [Methylocapsa aurea]|uniref:LPS-assembly protein LptD n=1 Tax=Methylocapsa aurea TaxID=663610 RepID=UPI00068B266A|nr:LPS-assembly protein LptD [Methylocapsa aurea]